MKKFLAVYMGTGATRSNAQWDKFDERQAQGNRDQGHQGLDGLGRDQCGRHRRSRHSARQNQARLQARHRGLQERPDGATSSCKRNRMRRRRSCSRTTRISRSSPVTRSRSWSACRCRGSDAHEGPMVIFVNLVDEMLARLRSHAVADGARMRRGYEALAAALAIALLCSCSDPGSSRESTDDAAAVRPPPLSWMAGLGRWIGPEGTFLLLEGGNGTYEVTIQNLDGPRRFQGVGRRRADRVRPRRREGILARDRRRRHRHEVAQRQVQLPDDPLRRRVLSRLTARPRWNVPDRA